MGEEQGERPEEMFEKTRARRAGVRKERETWEVFRA